MFRFLSRWSFFRHVSTLSCGKSNGVEQFAALFSYTVCIVPLYVVNIVEMELSLFGFFVFLALTAAGAGAFMYAGVKSGTPTIRNLQPLSLKRKILYDYLYPVYAAVVSMLYLLILCLFITVLVVIDLIISNYGIGNGGTTDGETFVEYANYMGVHGGITFACMCLSYYFAGMRAVYSPKMRTRIIYLLGYIAGLIILTVITAAPAKAKHLDSAIFGEVCYTATNVPWLFSAIWIILTLCICADTVWQTVRYVRRAKRL